MESPLVRRRRVLFFAEAVTLAHVARPLVLARALDPARYEVQVACSRAYDRFVAAEGFNGPALSSIEPAQFLRALARGRPVYDRATLRRYVDEDRALIEDFRPDLVVGDFRLSLSVSARLAGVPYAAISNAYWSPYAEDTRLAMPVLPLTRALPLPLAQALFDRFAPLALRAHARPLAALRRAAGLPPLPPSLRHTYTDADHVLYADVPALFPTRGLPATHHHIGPILWSPPAPLPSWWHDLPAGRPIVYVTLGSSGMGAVLPRVVQALTALPVTVLVATAGVPVALGRADNLFTADYLPGTEAAQRSALVVCNGGSPTSAQALCAGVPVLGIASNMDQFLNMRAIVKAGAGRLVRADRCTAAGVQQIASALLSSRDAAACARRLGEAMTRTPSATAFARLTPAMLA